MRPLAMRSSAQAARARRSSVKRPVQELKGFRRIHLEPGESKRVEMPVGAQELSFYDGSMKRVVEPGAFEVMVGGSSAEVQKARLVVGGKP